MKQFPRQYKKVAIVVLGEPSASHKQWVQKTVQAEIEASKALAERRKLLAEASGVVLGEEAEAPIEASVNGSDTWLLPRKDGHSSDVSEKELGRVYSHFSLPTEEEGFDEIRFEWQDKGAAQDVLRQWIMERKSSLLVDGLKPGPWFQAKMAAWKEERKKLSKGHADYQARKANSASGLDTSAIDLAGVTDMHNADDHGTPLYANFTYEDWLLLSWRYELHLLVHSFAIDVDDADIPGIPENHLGHYFALYFGIKCEPEAKFAVANRAEVYKLLKEPIEILEHQNGQRILSSRLDKETPLDAFVKSIESYRRDRKRRLEAGDESAHLSFPRPKPAAPKGAPAKAAPGKLRAAAAVPPKALPTKTTPAKALPGRGNGTVVAKTAPTKAAPRSAVQGSPPHLEKAAPRVLTKAQPTGAVKRPVPPGSAGAVDAAGPPLKRPRPPTGSPTVIVKAKAPIAKRKATAP